MFNHRSRHLKNVFPITEEGLVPVISDTITILILILHDIL